MSDKDDGKFGRVGHLTKGGVMYQFKGLASMVNAMKDWLRQVLTQQGIRLTREVESLIEQWGQDYHAKLDAHYRALGVPEPLAKLLRADRKSTAEKLCKHLRVTGEQFTALIYNHEQGGWKHREKHVEFVPEPLKVTDDDHQAFFVNRPMGVMDAAGRKFMKKVNGIFRQRHSRHVHMFERGDEWHCFYFSYDDAFDQRHVPQNHWKGGKHIHYLSHFWGLRAETVWQGFDQRKTSFPSMHIAYDHGRSGKARETDK